MPPLKEIPGFFYDEEKDKYFPIHMKAAYDRARKEKEAEVRRNEIASPLDLYKFMRNGQNRFDGLIERLDRINVCEINWPHPVQIEEDSGIFYRYMWENGVYTIQHVNFETDCILKEFEYECSDALLEFKVIPNLRTKISGQIGFKYDDGYYFIKGNKNSSEDIENNLDIIIPNSRKTDTVTIGPHGYNIFCNSQDHDIRYVTPIVTPDGRIDYRVVHYWTGPIRATSLRLYDRFELFCERFQVPYGITRIAEMNLRFFSKSTPKWMHYDQELDKFLMLTYHGSLYFVGNSKTTTDSQYNDIAELFTVKDIYNFDGKFEDLMIQSQEKVIVMGYRRGKEILMVDWSNPRRIIKTFSLPKPIEQFRLSSDHKNLFVHYK